MRIPPIYEKPGWQRFFAGAVIGALISWFIFLYQFGVLQEEQVRTIKEQTDTIKNLEARKETLIEDYKKLNEENKKKLKIQDFQVEFKNHNKLNLGEFDLHILKDTVIKDLNHLIGKDIESVDTEFLIKAIQNRIYELDEKKYKLHVTLIVLGTTLEIDINIVSVK